MTHSIFAGLSLCFAQAMGLYLWLRLLFRPDHRRLIFIVVTSGSSGRGDGSWMSEDRNRSEWNWKAEEMASCPVSYLRTGGIVRAMWIGLCDFSIPTIHGGTNLAGVNIFLPFMWLWPYYNERGDSLLWNEVIVIRLSAPCLLRIPFAYWFLLWIMGEILRIAGERKEDMSYG